MATNKQINFSFYNLIFPPPKYIIQYESSTNASAPYTSLSHLCIPRQTFNECHQKPARWKKKGQKPYT